MRTNMAKSDKSDRDFTVESEKRHRFRTIVVTTLIVAVIVLVTGYLGMRTEVAKKWVEGYFERRTGLKVTVKNVRIGWPYDMVIEGMKSAPIKGTDYASVSADTIRLGLRFGPLFKVEVAGARIQLQTTDDDRWEPDFLARLGKLRSVEEIAGLTARVRTHARIVLTRADIHWLNSRERRVARVDDLTFAMQPVVLHNGRRIYHCTMSAYEIVREDRSSISRMKREWFFTEANRFIEMAYEDAETKAADEKTDVWGREGPEQ